MKTRNLLIGLLVLSSGCTKVDPINFPVGLSKPPIILDPPITIEQLDLNQFEKADDESEALSIKEREKAIEALIDTARLIYFNKTLFLAETLETSQNLKSRTLMEMVQVPDLSRNLLTPISFDKDPLAIQILEKAKNRSICNLQLTEDYNVKPYQRTMTAHGASCPITLKSVKESIVQFGDPRIFQTTQTGELNVFLHSDLISQVAKPSVTSIQINSQENYVSQSFEAPRDGYRSFSTQSAKGDLANPEGDLIAYQHELKSVFEFTKNTDDPKYEFNSAHIHQVKLLLNGKNIIFTMKSSFDDSNSFFQCKINKLNLDSSECLLLFLQFKHF